MSKVRVKREQIELSRYKDAYDEVKAGVSLRSAAVKHGVNHCTLLRYIRKRDASGERGNPVIMGYKAHNRIFTVKQEKELTKYLIRCADIYFGLSKNQLRKFAFEFAIKYNLPRPKTWDDNELAGIEWCRIFLKRNPKLYARAEQATSLSEATSLNQNNEIAFYDNLTNLMDRYKFEPQDIYNTHETGITTVEKPDRVVARCDGARQKGSMTSTERSNFVSVAFAANAIGNVIPPFFVFSGSGYQDHIARDGPIGSAGTANPSGWLQDVSFLCFLYHLKKQTNASPSHKVLLVLENHSSHIHINALDFCKDNGIVLLSFPPHCSHKLQPLERSVSGPLKKSVNLTCDAWMRNHPGKTMSIYDIPGIVASAMPLALTSSNIQAGFRKTGIYPYNRQLYTEIDFVPGAFVTDSSGMKSSHQIINNKSTEIMGKMSTISKEEAFCQYLSTELLALKLEDSFDDFKMSAMLLLQSVKAKEKKILTDNNSVYRDCPAAVAGSASSSAYPCSAGCSKRRTSSNDYVLNDTIRSSKNDFVDAYDDKCSVMLSCEVKVEPDLEC